MKYIKLSEFVRAAKLLPEYLITHDIKILREDNSYLNVTLTDPWLKPKLGSMPPALTHPLRTSELAESSQARLKHVFSSYDGVIVYYYHTERYFFNKLPVGKKSFKPENELKLADILKTMDMEK